ncbi:MAG: sugar-binding domain-containing protein [Anaerolineales bacterium]
MTNTQKIANAIQAARMYYYQNLTTGVIAKEMNVSRSTVSRLLSFARSRGLVDIRIIEPTELPDRLANALVEKFGIEKVHVVPVPEITGEAEWLERVAQYTANYLNTKFDSNMILGIAWGTTLTAISKHLLRKTTHNSQIVQLNGAGNTQSMGIGYASQIIMRFSDNYRARAHLFPVPTF